MRKLFFICLLTPLTIFGVAKSSIRLPNNTPPHDSLMQLFKSLDTEMLQSTDEEAVSQYLIGKNHEILDYLAEKYPEFGSLEEIDVNDPMVQIFGYYYATMEANNFEPYEIGEDSRVPLPQWLRCAIDVIGAGSGIYALINGSAFTSYSSAWSLVRKLVIRYVGWLGVAYTLYEISTECF